MNNPITKLNTMVNGIKFSMLTTVDPDGSLSSRPMICQQTEFDGNFWFFTHKTSGKILSLMKDQHVGLTYTSATEYRVVSVSGRAEIHEDKDKAQEIWNSNHEEWFPNGLGDPDLVLIKVQVETAEYWDSNSSGVIPLLSLTKSLFSKQSVMSVDHERLNLN